MLDSFRVAAEVWTQCSRLHSDAKTPADRAAVKAEYFKIGEQVGGVKKARWLERRRLGFKLAEIHARTLREQDHQAANGQEITFPSFNTVSRKWFPSEGTVNQQLAAERKAASSAMEEEVLEPVGGVEKAAVVGSRRPRDRSRTAARPHSPRPRMGTLNTRGDGETAPR